MGTNDKRMPLRQALEMVHAHYDRIEAGSLPSALRALQDEFGFGPKRWERFKERYLEYYGEEAVKVMEDMKKEAKRRLGK
jgi:uncharacterized protein YeaO (DUF488 family)